MSYQTAKTIAEIVNDIHKKKYLLPAIQREFVWNTYQIERLFDSLMQDYPISSFLFWQVEKDKVLDFEFYEFLREFHEKNKRHNPKANVSGEDEVIAVLDGQQRLTSLYVGLKGSFSYKLSKKRWDNELAYPLRKLYLNILSNGNEENDFKYEFVFLTAEEAKVRDENHFWYEVGKILDMKEVEKVNEFLLENDIFSAYPKQKGVFANRCLSKLRNIVFDKQTISYYLEKSDKLDKVLNIFIRINSGGTVLSYSDLLLSVATAQWSEKDAREEITKLVDEINNIGSGFNFNKDFVLKVCLVLSDFPDIAFKVDNFNKENMLKIEENWEQISQSIRQAVVLVDRFGFNRETLSSNNALIPIAQYLYIKGNPKNFDTSSHTVQDRKNIQKWLILTLLKKVFGGKPDDIIKGIRDILKKNSDNFPLILIVERFKGSTKSLLFSNEDIENLLQLPYGNSYTFSLLSLLYPSLDFSNKFHVDHIFAKSLFSKNKLRSIGISNEEIDEFQSKFNIVSNLQLLEAIPNIEKQDEEFKTWIERLYSNSTEQSEYKEKHFIPKNIDLGIGNFLIFYNQRKELLVEKIREMTKID